MSVEILFIGCYTHESRSGLHLAELDALSGTVTLLHSMPELPHPSFVKVAKDKNLLLAVSEVEEKEGQPSGGIACYKLNGLERPELINQVLSQGTAPCHISLSKSENSALVSNYGSGSLVLAPITTDGQLEQVTSVQQHEGQGANQERQSGPHAHSSIVSPDGRFVICADLGIDELKTYQINETHQELMPHEQGGIKLQPGAGPRHMCFHPSGTALYLVNELDNTITVFHYNRENGWLNPLQTLAMLPDEYEGVSYGADIHLSKDGRFLYASNRGHNSILICTIDQETYKLSKLEYQSCKGDFPRNFALSPCQNFLLVANQNSHNLVTFKRDKDTGLLSDEHHQLSLSYPVCIEFLD